MAIHKSSKKMGKKPPTLTFTKTFNFEAKCAIAVYMLVCRKHFSDRLKAFSLFILCMEWGTAFQQL